MSAKGPPAPAAAPARKATPRTVLRKLNGAVARLDVQHPAPEWA